MNSSILRRLLTLQRAADENKPAQVTVCFRDGSSTTTTTAGAVDILQRMGPSGEIDRFQSDHPAFGPWAQLLTTLCHPVADRRIEDFE